MRSTKGPRNPADMPRKRMAIENAQVVSERLIPMVSITGLVNTLQA